MKTVCEKLISDCVAAATLPIKSFMERSSAPLDNIGNSSRARQASTVQDTTTSKQAMEVNQEFKAVCEREVRQWAERVRLFLDDERTVAALCSPLERHIVETYALFRGLLAGRYGAELLEQAYTEHGLLNTLRQWDGSNP